jgi:L-threonylcarbamoyladenylate synthase
LLSWKTKGDMRFVEVRALSEQNDLKAAAANLFRLLRELDASSLNLIVAERLPDEGLGAAMNDRLARASSRQ